MIVALFVETDGVYYGLPDVDPWDRARDARTYAGPYPVVAHPPCERWGRFWHGSTRRPHQFQLGADDGCFAAAWRAVNAFGGVIEHPADSRAWDAFGIIRPPRCGGWIQSGAGWTCCIEQGFYGHASRKPTWLYAAGFLPPPLQWGRGEQRLHPIALARHGYEKARRIGMMAMIGGKDKKKIRDRTPIEFRDLLLSLASKTTWRNHMTDHILTNKLQLKEKQMTKQEKKLDQVAEVYIKIRDARSDLKRKYEEEDQKLKDQMETISGFLLETLTAQGIDSARTQHGTIYKSLDVKPSCEDWDSFGDWIIENRAIEALEKRVKRSFIVEYMETHGDELPPGINVLKEYIIKVLRK